MKHFIHPHPHPHSHSQTPLSFYSHHQKSQSPHFQPLLVFSLLTISLFFSVIIAVSFGSTSIPFETIIQILLTKSGIPPFSSSSTWDSSVEVIIWQLRLPTVIGTALVGAALATAGSLFQGILRNPLADPFLIGTSSGAALGATISFILPISLTANLFFPLTPLLAFVGALSTVLFVYLMARTGERTPVVTLLLAGVIVNAVLVACQTLLLTVKPPTQATGFLSLFQWLSGGITAVNWQVLAVITVLVLFGLVFAQIYASRLDAFAMGEEVASHLGLHVEQTKFVIVIIGALLTAAAVSISGLVGFVGLVTPHIMRLILGPQHRILLPASALAGAIFLILADVLARVLLAPSVIPVGVFTAFIGAPFFLFLLRKNKRDYRW